VVGRKGFVVDKVEDVTDAQLVSHILEGMYTEAPPLGVPKEVLVPFDPDDCEFYERWLGGLRGSNVTVRVPKRGDKRGLQATVEQNAKEEFVRHRLKRASDHNARARALNALQDALDLPFAPLRIECFDMSHIQGSDYVGSMVVMDEAHRFAITYHRQLRGKRMTKSVLDDVPGLGPTRKKRLVKELGGVNAVKHATLEELDDLKWLPEKVAHTLYLKLHGLPVP